MQVSRRSGARPGEAAAPGAPCPLPSPAPARLLLALLMPILLLPVVAGSPRTAWAGNPSLDWRTLHTEHFRIHCPGHLLPFGRRVAQAAEEAWQLLVPRLGWQPAGPLELKVEDEVDDANGMASTLPYNRILVYAVPPDAQGSLNDHDDWLRLLLYHETAHIVHLDQATGLPALLNRVVGRTFLPGLAQPRWLQEGIAVWEESNLTGAGRLRSSLFKGQLRVAALAGRLPPPDWLSAVPVGFPWGSSWYLYGSSFVAYLVERHGEQAIAQLNRSYGRRLLPYALNRSAREAFGETLEQAWEGWRIALTRWARAEEEQLRRQGLVEGEALTLGGETHARPVFAPAAPGAGMRLLYFLSDEHRHGGLYLRAGPDHLPGEGELVLESNGEAAAAWDPGGASFVFSQQEVLSGLYVYHDLYRHELRGGRTVRLTHGLRARDPDVAPDGRIAFVASEAGRTRLHVAGPSVESPRQLDVPGVPLVSSPRFSPDGRWLAVSGWRESTGERDIYLVDPLGRQAVQRLTSGRALDIDPAWSPDGSTLFFASDRSGIYDIYAYGLADGMVRRVTRVRGGAFAPAISPDGRTLVYVALGATGYDLRRLDLPPTDSLPPAPATSAAERHQPRRYSGGEVLQPELADRPYSPWPSLLPRAYGPSFGATGIGESWGILVAGEDAVGLHRYMLQLEWATEEEAPLFSAAYVYDRFYPQLTLSASRWVQTYPDGYTAGEQRFPYTEEGLRGSFQLSVPFHLYRNAHSLGLGYSATRYRALSALPIPDPATLAPSYPGTGVMAGLSLGWSFSNLERYGYGISTERGRLASLTLVLRDPVLGSDWSSLTLGWVLHQFLALPWLAHHVLSLRLAGGIGSGQPGSRPSFALGGPPPQDVILALVDESFVGNNGYLRGYPPGAMAGDRYLLLNAEYRLPLLQVGRGLGLLPLYLQRLVLCSFLDAGAARYGRFALDKAKKGAGLELRADLTLGYYLEAALRLGHAWGLDDGAEDQWYLLLGNAL